MTIGDVLELERPLAVLDLETTSLNVSEARIVEIGLRVYYPRELEKDTFEWSTIVDPCIMIPKASSETTGIDDNIVDKGNAGKPWPKFVQLAGRLARFLSNVDFAGKNVRYDLNVLAHEMFRAKCTWSFAGAAIICADRVEQLLEPRDLSTLYKRRTGREPVGAHRALSDVVMTDELIAVQLNGNMHVFYDGGDKVNGYTARRLHDALWKNWIDSEGKFKFDQMGQPVMAFGKHKGSLMQDVPADYWKFILREDFNSEIKTIARAAMAGTFPTRGEGR